MPTDDFSMGVTATNAGRCAADCPFPTGERRQKWLAGFFSEKAVQKETPCSGQEPKKPRLDILKAHARIRLPIPTAPLKRES